jgi:ABC-type Mn2+/Zn2+ transport system ATPase subunit
MPNSSLLNAGGKKCITIATVLSMNPSILVLDEPPAGLDPRTTVMDEGQVVADGFTIKILENEELLTAHGLEKL